jgi:hypothetical protein
MVLQVASTIKAFFKSGSVAPATIIKQEIKAKKPRRENNLNLIL